MITLSGFNSIKFRPRLQPFLTLKEKDRCWPSKLMWQQKALPCKKAPFYSESNLICERQNALAFQPCKISISSNQNLGHICWSCNKLVNNILRKIFFFMRNLSRNHSLDSVDCDWLWKPLYFHFYCIKYEIKWYLNAI